jgi:hypothetical protein
MKNMWKINEIVGIVILGFIFGGCATTSLSSKNSVTSQADSLFILNNAITKASENILEKIPENTKVALYNLSSTESELTDYVTEEMAVILVGTGI